MTEQTTPTTSTATTRPSLAEVMGTLDELAAAVRVDDPERYRAALAVAQRQGLTEEQMRDSHTWGGRTRATPARFV